MPTTPETSLKNWLVKLNFKVSSTLIDQKLKSHPDYPSLLSITDTLDYLGIENGAYEIAKDQLHEIDTPFLAHLRSNGGEFIIGENRDALDKLYPGFFERWSGVVVVAERSEKWQHRENSKMIQKEKKQANERILILTSVITISFVSFLFAAGWQMQALSIVAMAGMFISGLIITKELGIENKIATKVCGKETDCDAVIRSKDAKLLQGISWGDAGVTWFTSLLILTTLSSFAGNHASVLNVLGILSAASILFSVFSIYYQWKVAKKWCRLCLATVGIIWGQFFITLPTLTNASWQAIQIKEVFFIGAILFLVSAGWLTIKKLLNQERRSENSLLEAARFKRNENIFLALLGKGRKVNITPWENDLQLANPNAPTQIMVACNPYCGPCAGAHEKLHELVENLSDKIGLTVRFTASAKNKEDKRTKALQHILQHLEEVSSNMNVIEKAGYSKEVLHQWFKLMSYEKFAEQFPVIVSNDVDEMINKHEQWMKESEIAFTPTIFINGHQFPKQYAVGDLQDLVKVILNGNEELMLNNELKADEIFI